MLIPVWRNNCHFNLCPSHLRGLPVSDGSEVLTYIEPNLPLLLTTLLKKNNPSNCVATIAMQFSGLVNEEKRLRQFCRGVQLAHDLLAFRILDC